MNNHIFISHSSKDIEFINQLNDFLVGLGVNRENIFCSSIEGQGVKQGERIEDTVKTQLINSNIIIYILSQNFLESQACMEELGVGWISNDSKKCFYFKLDDITMDEIKGLLSTNYKFTFITQRSLSEFIDDFCESTKLPNLKATETLKLINSLMKKSLTFIEKIVDQKKLTDEEKEKKVLEKLYKSIKKLNLGEKKIISNIYFEEDQCRLFDCTSGVINLLVNKKIAYRLTNMSTVGTYFQYTLNPWIKDYIDNNVDFKKELSKYYESPSNNPYSYF